MAETDSADVAIGINYLKRGKLAETRYLVTMR
jgi:hypothetical protein